MCSWFVYTLYYDKAVIQNHSDPYPSIWFIFSKNLRSISIFCWSESMRVCTSLIFIFCSLETRSNREKWSLIFIGITRANDIFSSQHEILEIILPRRKRRLKCSNLFGPTSKRSTRKISPVNSLKLFATRPKRFQPSSLSSRRCYWTIVASNFSYYEHFERRFE